MGKSFKGKISLDIRDSEPDWTPFLRPEAAKDAPNVLLLAWDDVGYGTMDIYGGPVEAPNMRRIAEAGVRYSNFHTTALCSPTRASLLTGRNATSNGMATIAEFSSGFPGISTRIPFENGFISEKQPSPPRRSRERAALGVVSRLSLGTSCKRHRASDGASAMRDEQRCRSPFRLSRFGRAAP